MSPMLTIDGTDVRIARPTSYDVPAFGDFGRAFSGKLRSDLRADHRVIRVETPELDNATEAEPLLAILRGAPPLTCSGDLIGSPSADFHVTPGSIRVTPITATDSIISFELQETDAMP